MEQAAQQTPVKVFSPAEYNIAPQWQPSVVQQCVNRYKQVIKPLSFSTSRGSWSTRSPGLGIVMSPLLVLEMAFDLKVPGGIDYVTGLGPVLTKVDRADVGAAGANDTYNVAYGQKVCFGEQDAVGASVSSIQVTINGQTLSNSRLTDYKNSFDRCQYNDDLFQKRFATCGGLPQQYDCQPVSGEAFVRGYDQDDAHSIRETGAQHPATLGFTIGDGTHQAANAVAPGIAVSIPAVVAWTGDSGITQRIENFFSCIQSNVAAGAGNEATGYDTRRVLVRWAINGAAGIFSPLGPTDEISVCSPYRNSALALPHINSLQVDILWENLAANLFRSLSRRIPYGATIALGGGPAVGLQVSYVADSAVMIAEYLRLPSWKSIPSSVNLQCYRAAVHNPTSQVASAQTIVVPAASLRGASDLANGLRCVGFGRQDDRRTAKEDTAQNRFLTVDFDGIVSAQPARWLLFCLQKSADMFVGTAATEAQFVNNWGTFAAGDPAGLGNLSSTKAGLMNQALCRNTTANAAIRRFSLEIQTSQGSYSFAGDVKPFLRTKSELYRDHLKSMPSRYMDITRWYKYNCCLLLGVNDYMRGLASSGESYPVTISASVEFQSCRQYIDGHGAAAHASIGTACFQDKIAGKPVMVQIFDSSSLSVSSSSALLSAQNLSHTQSTEILSRS